MHLYQMVQWKTGIICLQSIYCKHWNNYIITVQHSPLLVQCTYASAWRARRFRGEKILSDACAATHAPPTKTSSSSRLHNRDAILELLSPFIQLCMTHTPVTVLNSHPTMNLYRFHAFTKQKSHNTSLLLLSALLQGHRHLVELFPRFLCVPQVCQRHLLVAQGHRLRIPYTQWYRSYRRFLIQLFRFSTERPLYVVIIT